MAGEDYDGAEQWFRKAVTIDRKQPHYACQLGLAYQARGRLTEAMASYEKALKLQPGHPEALAGKAAVLLLRGKYDRGWNLLEPILRAPDFNPALAGTATGLLVAMKKLEQAVEFARAQLARSDMLDLNRRRVLFPLAKALHQLGAYDDAFAAYTDANAIGRVPVDLERRRRKGARLMSILSPTSLAELPRSSFTTERPVFIVGLPRCGSTLIEQIIHAHPQGHGAGELLIMSHLVVGMQTTLSAETGYPECLADITTEKLDVLAEHYVTRLPRVGGRVERVVDKALNNFEHIGLLHLMFPNARVIHARRHPMDLCLSCFIQDLAVKWHPYASDLHDLGQIYRLYDTLMSHWRDTCALPMLDVDYEDLVSNQEAVSRRIIDYIGLGWDDRCLQFHQEKRSVITASYDQVRKPMYATAVARYVRYEKHLGPLRDALGDLAHA